MRKKKKCLNCGYWNYPEAPYCNLCYAPFRRPGESAAAAPRAAAVPEKRGLHPAARIIAAAGLAVAAVTAGFVVLRDQRPAAPGLPSFSGINRFAVSARAADKLLEDYIAAKKELLAVISEGPVDPEGFGLSGEYTRKLFSIEESYARELEALDLPRRGQLDGANDAAYLEWLEARQGREARFMEEFGREYQRLLDKAAAGYLPPQ